LLTIDSSDPRLIGDIYWQVDDFKTISKLQAIQKAGGDIGRVQYHWMDQTWENYDMSVDPVLSWDELLKIRAWQLRDRYGYLVLCYSGGWDSTPVLMTFARHNIPLDEIIIWDRREYMDDPEIPDAVEYAKKVVNEYHMTTKITVFDVPWDYHARIFEQAGEDYIFLPGCQMSFNQTTRILKQDVLDTYLDIKKKFTEDQVCFIEAHDKPRVNLYDGKWYQFYVDSAMYSYYGKGITEMFYFSDQLPELHAKQVHMSIRYFENLLQADLTLTPDIVHKVQGFSDKRLYAEWNQHIGRISSPNYSAIHGLGKPTNMVDISKRELSKITGHTKQHMQKIYSIWKNGHQKVKEITGVDVANGETVPAIISKQHYVRDFFKSS